MPKTKLTETALKTLTRLADDIQTDYFDTELPGLSVRVGATNKTFRVNHRVAGKMVRTTIGHFPEMSVADARKAARVTLGQMAEGKNPNVGRRTGQGPTLQMALDHHIGKMEAGQNRRKKVCSPRSIETLKGAIERHFAAWLDRPLIELDADAIESVLDKVLTSTKRRSDANPKNPPGRALANRLLSNVGSIWRSYHRRYGLPVANPCERLMSGALAPRDSRVSDFVGWMTKVQAIENPVRRDLQLFSLFSAVRSDGLRHLRWDDIDLDEELIHIARAKGDKPYTIVMTQTLREILERRQTDNAPIALAHPHTAAWVFPSPDDDEGCVGEVKQRRAVYDTDGDLEGWESIVPGPHVNRRSYNSVAMEIGCPPEIRERLLNHSGKGVNVRHYGRPEDWTLTRQWADKIEKALWERIRDTRPAKGRGKMKLAA